MCSISLVYKPQIYSLKVTPSKLLSTGAAKHFDVPTVSQVHTGQLVRVSLCAKVVYKWPDAWCHSEFKGLTVSKKVPVGPTWVRVQPLLCKHKPPWSPRAPGRGTISCRAGESLMCERRRRAHTHPHTHACTLTHRKRWGKDFGD